MTEYINLTDVEPFMKDGVIDIKYQPMRDMIFVLSERSEQKIGSIIIPEDARENLGRETGVVLAAGKGHTSPQSGKFIPISLKVGDIIVYNKEVPWEVEIEDNFGKKHTVKMMCERDAIGVVE